MAKDKKMNDKKKTGQQSQTEGQIAGSELITGTEAGVAIPESGVNFSKKKK